MSIDFQPFMEQALEEAEKGFNQNEVPVGAVILNDDYEIIARAHNQPISLNDPTAHAEILALREAGEYCKNYRLIETTLVVTIEPCIMCMGAALNARVDRIVFGAIDSKGGAAGSLYNLAQDNRLNHQVELISGIMESECRKMIQDFFRLRRGR